MTPFAQVALGLAVGLSSPPLVHAAVAGPPQAPDVAELLRQADAAFEEGRLLDALDAIDAAEAQQPEPFYDYMRGLIRQAQGRCDLAVEHWAQYLDSEPAESDAADVQVLIEQCGGLPEPPATAPPEADDPVEAPAAVAGPPPTEPRDGPPPRPWHRDPAGATLLGVGTVSLASAGGLWLAAGLQQGRGPDSETLMLHDDRIRSAKTLRYAAIATGVVGTALVVGAIVRFVKVRRNGRTRPATALRALRGL